MTKHVTIQDPSGQAPYTLLESVDDVGTVFCFAPDGDLIQRIEEGKIIMVNRMGGYCFFEEGYHTIVD